MDDWKTSLWLALVAVILSLCLSQPPLGGEPGQFNGTLPKDGLPRPQDQRRPCNGTWSSWENWSSCNSACGQYGTRTRNRQCEAPERPRRCRRVGFANCTGSNFEQTYCNGDCGQQFSSFTRFTTMRPPFRTQFPRNPSPSPPFDGCASGNLRGGWGEWGCWSPCSFGLRVRYRECNNPPPVGLYNYCSGIKDDRQSCFSGRTTTMTTTEAPLCTNGQDVVFAVDSSGSIGSGNFQQMSNDLLNVIRQFNLDYIGSRDSRRARVGIITFATNAIARNYLDQFNVPSSLPYSAGGTNTGAGIDLARTQLFQSFRGDRSQNPNLLVVFTDGRSNNRQNTINAASRAKAAGIKILAWGIGNNIDPTELRSIATDPNSDVYTVSGFNELRNEINKVFRC